MKTKRVGLCVIAVFLIVVLIYSGIQKKHTVTLLNNDEDRIKTEQIQPLWEIVKVSGDRDTDVVFTDVETGKQYTIGYITHGITEKSNLKATNGIRWRAEVISRSAL